MRGVSGCFILAVICAAGCSGNGEIVKSKVSGEVTYNSSPVQRGEIRFIPKGETQGPLATASINEGVYEVNAAGGVPVGTHRVEIVAYVDLPKPPNAPPIAPTPRLQYIPEKYNVKSELEFEVASGGDQSADFELDGPNVNVAAQAN